MEGLGQRGPRLSWRAQETTADGRSSADTATVPQGPTLTGGKGLLAKAKFVRLFFFKLTFLVQKLDVTITKGDPELLSPLKFGQFVKTAVLVIIGGGD